MLKKERKGTSKSSATKRGLQLITEQRRMQKPETENGVETALHERDPETVEELCSDAAEDLYEERPAETSEACAQMVSTIERIEGRTCDGLCLKFTHNDLDRAPSQTSTSSTPGLDNVQGFAMKHAPAWLQTLFLEVSWKCPTQFARAPRKHPHDGCRAKS